MPEPRVVQVMRQFKAELLAQEDAQMRRMAEKWLTIEADLRAAFYELAQEVAARRHFGEPVTRAMLLRMGHYRRLLLQVQRAIVVDYAPWVAREVAAQQAVLLRAGISHAQRTIQAAAADQGSLGASFTRLPVEAVENMVGVTGAGSPLVSVLADAYPATANAATNALITATARGVNPRDTAQQMIRATGSTALNRALVIARTEQLRVYREASRAQYIESGLVRGFARIATHDRRVCAACLGLEGEYYDVRAPLRVHPQCRCGMIPIVRGYRALAFELGDSWLGRQPTDVQEGILGRAGLEAWRRGTPLRRFATIIPNSTWGDTVSVTPINRM